jgi:hypothetical protein
MTQPFLATLNKTFYEPSDPRTNAICWVSDSKDWMDVSIEYLDPAVDMYEMYIHVHQQDLKLNDYGPDNADMDNIDYIIERSRIYSRSWLIPLDPQKIVDLRLKCII